MLHAFLAEQEERQVRLKQQREHKKVRDPPKAKTTDASIQCALVQMQSADAAVQTDLSGDVVQELKEQVLNLTKIASELMTYKAQTQTIQVSEGDQNPPRGSLLTELLSDSIGDLQELCPDSYENSSAATPETPLPGVTPRYNSSPFAYPPRAPLRVIQENGIVNSPPCPTEQQRQNVDAIVFRGTEMSTTALACVDVLFTEAELANGNTGGTFGYDKLDGRKISYLSSALRQKFDSPSFESQWEAVRVKINSKCRGKRRTVIKRLKIKAI